MTDDPAIHSNVGLFLQNLCSMFIDDIFDFTGKLGCLESLCKIEGSVKMANHPSVLTQEDSKFSCLFSHHHIPSVAKWIQLFAFLIH
ncbi:hypothetical protein NPIL_327071 [Nephila pilipes]|uniref:Uncharacterized protein n=1 Tax=Nephila pilipes TaxID=299642 RepID=A0A8X6THY8_NEPPI|nr:hypothetical protein NPIL_327071 [Nephila pilipes]